MSELCCCAGPGPHWMNSWFPSRAVLVLALTLPLALPALSPSPLLQPPIRNLTRWVNSYRRLLRLNLGGRPPQLSVDASVQVHFHPTRMVTRTYVGKRRRRLGRAIQASAGGWMVEHRRRRTFSVYWANSCALAVFSTAHSGSPPQAARWYGSVRML
jgi:hypothetical protein